MGELRAFVDAEEYRDPRWWLSEGWQWVQQGAREAPHNLALRDGAAQVFGVDSTREALDDEPRHLTLYEADALARASAAGCHGVRVGGRVARRRAARGQRPRAGGAAPVARGGWGRRARADVRRRLGVDRVGLQGLSAFARPRAPSGSTTGSSW
ncbi:MAG: hypothetical protein U0325_00085 [Polyangiales bacterium]